MSEVHRCIGGCGKVVTWQFALCRSCEERYGVSPYDWPDWLRYLWSDIQRERRRDRRITEFEVPLSDRPLSNHGRGARKPGAE